MTAALIALAAALLAVGLALVVTAPTVRAATAGWALTLTAGWLWLAALHHAERRTR